MPFHNWIFSRSWHTWNWKYRDWNYQNEQNL